jgi:hypothetical protein
VQFVVPLKFKREVDDERLSCYLKMPHVWKNSGLSNRSRLGLEPYFACKCTTLILPAVLSSDLEICSEHTLHKRDKHMEVK